MAKLKKITEWESTIDGQNYAFIYERKGKEHILTVNDETITIKASLSSSLIEFDEPFTFDGKEARFAKIGSEMDVAYSGVFLRTGKKYITRPKWVWIFAILCLAIPVVTLGGALPFLIGFGGAMLCVAVSKTELPTAIRVLLCLFTTGAAWLIMILFVGMLLLA